MYTMFYCIYFFFELQIFTSTQHFFQFSKSVKCLCYSSSHKLVTKQYFFGTQYKTVNVNNFDTVLRRKMYINTLQVS